MLNFNGPHDFDDDHSEENRATAKSNVLYFNGLHDFDDDHIEEKGFEFDLLLGLLQNEVAIKREDSREAISISHTEEQWYDSHERNTRLHLGLGEYKRILKVEKLMFPMFGKRRYFSQIS